MVTNVTMAQAYPGLPQAGAQLHLRSSRVRCVLLLCRHFCRLSSCSLEAITLMDMEVCAVFLAVTFLQRSQAAMSSSVCMGVLASCACQASGLCVDVGVLDADCVALGCCLVVVFRCLCAALLTADRT